MTCGRENNSAIGSLHAHACKSVDSDDLLYCFIGWQAWVEESYLGCCSLAMIESDVLHASGGNDWSVETVEVVA